MAAAAAVPETASEISAAVARMLHWRGQEWVPRDADWGHHAIVKQIGAARSDPLLYHVPAAGTLLLITDAVRIGLSVIKALHEIAHRYGLDHIQLVCKHPVTNHTQSLIPLENWLSVISCPIHGGHTHTHTHTRPKQKETPPQSGHPWTDPGTSS